MAEPDGGSPDSSLPPYLDPHIRWARNTTMVLVAAALAAFIATRPGHPWVLAIVLGAVLLVVGLVSFAVSERYMARRWNETGHDGT